MKMKSFAMLAMSGLIAASVAYVAPAMADDMTGTNPDAQQPAQPAPSTPSDNSAQNQGTMIQNNAPAPADSGTSTGTGNNDAASSSSSNTDEGGSPDTATGDDDY